MFLRMLNRAEEGIIALLLVAMVFLTFGEVIGRFVFNHGALWAEELTLHLSAWLVLFGASWGVKMGAHIGVDAFVKLFSSGVQRIFGLIAVALATLYCALLIYGGWVYLAKLLKIGIEMEDLPVPKWLAHSILVIGLALLALRLLQLLWQIVKGESLSFRQVDEAQEALEELQSEQAADREPGT
jgi:C4-dicarboxylate transporter DctQ subunit